MEGPNKVRGLEKNRKINKRGGDVYLAPESTGQMEIPGCKEKFTIGIYQLGVDSF